jgi:HAD superfamily hydrolase (TIGR01458 family)
VTLLAMADIRTVLIDIDGVLTVSWRALPGAVDALARLRADGVSVAFVTNTTSRPRSMITRALTDAGFAVDEREVFTAPAMAAAYLLARHPGARVHLLSGGDATADLAGVELVAGPERPDVVLLGGGGPEYSYAAVNRVLGWALDGVPVVAMHRNFYWRTDDGLSADTGTFLAGLEEAAHFTATVVGKPARAFFAAALDALGAAPGTAMMIGDDIDNDVLGAQRHGLVGVLVRTGKFRPSALRDAAGRPDHVIDSFADLPELLTRTRSQVRTEAQARPGPTDGRLRGDRSPRSRP